MKDAINYLFENYEKAFKLTRTLCKNLKTTLKDLKQEIIQNIPEYYDQNFKKVVKLYNKLVTSNYLLIENYLNIVHIRDQYNEKQQKLIDEYPKITKSVTKLNFEVTDFINEYKIETNNNF